MLLILIRVVHSTIVIDERLIVIVFRFGTRLLLSIYGASLLILSFFVFSFEFIFSGKFAFDIFKALHGRLKSQRDGKGGKLTVDPPFSFRRERGTGKI